jgi:hypothetical protein
MKRFVPTRGAATVFMALSLCVVLTLAALTPFTALRPATVMYAAMLVTGCGMLLRERVFASSPR